MQVGEFHWQDGWTFMRESDGTVWVRKYADAGQRVEIELRIPSNEWASIVEAVGAPAEPQEGAQ